MKFLREILKYLAINAVVWVAVAPTHWVPFMDGSLLQPLVALSLFMGVPALIVVSFANLLVSSWPRLPLRVLLAIGLSLSALLFLQAISWIPLVVQLVIQFCYVAVARPIWAESESEGSVN
ncbi:MULTISPECIES: hypothetical protein [unclassified Kitasatospora]|uniref:hypothetical protein n=1 Tax=unclassified Kitasatospora TaxID=2633591 RepID=UPI00070F0C94|nr:MULTISPECIES: hypothetical protein [unclassified Kitasatospora]KQV15523.1 hypothetical protein ASC99_08040 [Kitasatospora sp. Root107]KRB63890.1 hypothetical protein ASE03_04825 [Kitasatospora sp. Root187]